MVQYSCTVFLLHHFSDSAPPWPTVRQPPTAQQHVITSGLPMNEIAFASHTSTGRVLVITSQVPGFLYRRSHISSWATLMLTKHQLVITVLEWPIEATGQGAAGVPKEPCQEGWGRQRSPSHLCPLGCVLTTALGPWESHPNKTRRGRGGTRQGQGHFSVIDRRQTNDIRQDGLLYGLLTLKVTRWKICKELT